MAERRGLRKALSNLREMTFPRQGWRMWAQPRSNFNYAAEVGDGTGSSTVMAPLNWIARTFPAAPVELKKILKDGQEELEVGHDLIRLLHRPNPFYSGKLLWQATALDFYVDGNSYWIKLRNSYTQQVEQLWWVPSTLIEPKAPDNGDSSVFIDYFDYRPNGVQIKLPPEDVVHFRFGIDKDNQRKGCSPMKSVLREIFTDDEAGNYTAALLKNMGVPGIIIAPKESGKGTGFDDVQAAKDYFSSAFKGDKRGEPMVSNGPTDVQEFGFSPEQMTLKDLRRIPEERVTAVLGIPAIVCGLGAGLDRSTFANFSEARKAAYESNIIPAQEVMAEDVRFQLLPDFEADPLAWAVGFDLSDVRILQEDENKKAERMVTLAKNGIIKRAEARREVGFEAKPEDDVYLVPINLLEVGEPGVAPAQLPEETKGIQLKGKQQDYQRQIIKAFERDAAALRQGMKRELEQDLHQLGIKAAQAFEAHVTADDLEVKGRDDVQIKLSDEHNAHNVVLSLNVDEWREKVLAKRFGTNAARTIKQVLDTVKTSLDMEIELAESVEKSVISKGGTRAGLVDIEKQTKDSILRAIAKGREDKLDPKAIADLIRDEVPKGRYTNAGAEYRAESIARTEVKFAQNESSIQVYKAASGIKECIAFDGSSDEVCAQRNGETFSFSEAEAEAANEHTNGNLSFAPVVTG